MTGMIGLKLRYAGQNSRACDCSAVQCSVVVESRDVALSPTINTVECSGVDKCCAMTCARGRDTGDSCHNHHEANLSLHCNSLASPEVKLNLLHFTTLPCTQL